MHFLDDHDSELLVLVSSIFATYILSQWIPENYYILEYTFLILLFGLIQEAWSGMQTDEGKRDFIEFFGMDSRTGRQIALLLFIGSTVLVSLELRYFVESIFGQLSVVQMMGIIVILSRAYVNVYISKDLLSVIDGNPDTFAAYFAGAIAFIISWQIRGGYPVGTSIHVSISIWPAIIIPYLLFYYLGFGKDLPKLGSSAP